MPAPRSFKQSILYHQPAFYRGRPELEINFGNSQIRFIFYDLICRILKRRSREPLCHVSHRYEANKILFQVKMWITFNEPYETCVRGYAEGVNAPAFRPGVGDYLCAHTILRAHAKAYHLYKKKFASQGGKSN